MCIPFDPEILIPEIVPTEIVTYIHKNIQTNTVIAALCKGEKPKSPSVDEQLKNDGPSIFWNIIQGLKK